MIPLTVNKIASSGGFSPQKPSFTLNRLPLNTSFTVCSGPQNPNYPNQIKLFKLFTILPITLLPRLVIVKQTFTSLRFVRNVKEVLFYR